MVSLGRLDLLDQTIHVLVPRQRVFLLILVVKQLDDVWHRYLTLDPMAHILEHFWARSNDRTLILQLQVVIVLHDDGARAKISEPVIVPLELDNDRAIKFLSIPQLHTLMNLIALLKPLLAAQTESNHKARIIVPPDVILFELDLEQKAQLVVCI